MAGLQRDLLAWYDTARRDLPWRRTRDPYAIWISEIMLQQTRVETVRPYFQRWMERLPTVAALATAPLDTVLKLWEGLGYYTRARNLHRAAQQIVAMRGGQLPSSAAGWAELPGIGRYTAAAIGSIAFDEPVAALDGNIMRVLARIHAIHAPINETPTRDRLWNLADELLERTRPGDFNQAVMELGATICSSVAPHCLLCPVQRHCAARAAGLQEQLPRKSPKRPVPVIHAVAIGLRRRGRVLWLQRPATGLLGGLWELPSVALPHADAAVHELATIAVKNLTSLTLNAATLERLGEVRHVFTHRDLRLQVFSAESLAGRARATTHVAARWLQSKDLAKLALAKLDQKVAAVIRGRIEQ